MSFLSDSDIILILDDNEPWSKSCSILYKEEKIGLVGFQGHPIIPTKWSDRGETLIGYEIYEEYRNKGYATLACSILLNWGFNKSYQNLLTVKAHTIHGWNLIGEKVRGNPASIRVLEKLGAIYDGHHHDDDVGEVLI